MVLLYTESLDRKLAGVVRHDLPRVPADARKFEAFKEFGQFSDAEARAALRPGSGPVLHVTDLPPGTYGSYLSGDEIHISRTIVSQHENIINSWGAASAYGSGNDDRWRELVRKATLIVESVILHELVHWGDLKDGKASDDEAIRHGRKDLGHMFVHHAYGHQFAIEKDRLRHRGVKLPKLSIEGWMGWGIVTHKGKSFAVPYDPWAGRGLAAGPPLPP